MLALIKKSLIILALGTISAPLYAQALGNCQTLLNQLLTDYHSRIETLFYKEGLRVKEVEIADWGTYVSHPKIRHIGINKNASLIEKRVVLEHEVTHFTTDRNIEKNPSAENIAKGVRIIKWQSPIDESLPKEYQKEFRLDEAGAHFDESAFAFSLLPHFIDHPLSSWLIKTSDEGLRESTRFAQAGKKAISQVMSEIKKGRVEDFGVKHFKYPKAHYDVFVTVRVSNELVTLAIPLFETKLDPFMDRALLDKKILSVLALSVKYADTYSRKNSLP